MNIKDKATEIIIKQTIKSIKEDPEKNLPKAIRTVKGFLGGKKGYEQQFEVVEQVLTDTKSNWFQFIENILEDVDQSIVEKFVCNFVVNALLKGIPKTYELKEKEGHCFPWAILMDPTSSCNLQCTGCWAAEYGNKLNLGYDLMNRIVTEGKDLGCYWYLFTGGEPLVKKDEILRLCEEHNDCMFLAFTNATLIDEEFAEKVAKVGNLTFAISVEGTEESTDSRRGKGTYQKIMKAMDILKEHKILFGFSTCSTSVNEEYVTSEEYIDKMEEKGCKYGWFFDYMPVGCDSVPDLMISAEQREHMYHTIRKYRETKPLFLLDFWNDGEFSGGCVAGGRYYMHINANGDVEPCAFIHYSNVNIKDVSLKEALKQPLFMEYQRNQPFSDNLLRPCPLLDNEGKLAEMVNRCGAYSTDLANPENVDSLCAKCSNCSKEWKEKADKLWNDSEGIKVKQEEMV